MFFRELAPEPGFCLLNHHWLPRFFPGVSAPERSVLVCLTSTATSTATALSDHLCLVSVHRCSNRVSA